MKKDRHNIRFRHSSNVLLLILMAFVLVAPSASVAAESAVDKFNQAMGEKTAVLDTEPIHQPVVTPEQPPKAIITQPAAVAEQQTTAPVDPVTQLYRLIDSAGYVYVANANNRVTVYGDAEESETYGVVGSGVMVAAGYDTERGMLFVHFESDGAYEGWIRVGNTVLLNQLQIAALWDAETPVILGIGNQNFAVEVLSYKPDATPTPKPQADAPTPDAAETPQPEMPRPSPSADITTELPPTIAPQEPEQSPLPTDEATLVPSSLEEETLQPSAAPSSLEETDAAESPTPEPSPLPPSSLDELEPEAIQVAQFILDAVVLDYEVPRGTEPLDLPLPKTLTALDLNGAQLEVPVVWTNGNARTDIALMETLPLENADTTDYVANMHNSYGSWIFTLLPGAGYTYTGEAVTAQVAFAASKEIVQFVMDEVPLGYEVARGTEPVNLPLPKTLRAINVDGAEIEAPVVWINGNARTDTALVETPFVEEPSETDYVSGSQSGYGPWEFALQTTEGYSYTGESIVAQIWYPDCTEVYEFFGVCKEGLLYRFVIDAGGTIQIGDYATAVMADGGIQNVPISVSGSYDNRVPGVYTLRIHTAGGYSGGNATCEVIVQAAAKGGDEL